MKIRTLIRLHKFAAICAFLLIVTFFTSSIIADLWGNDEVIALVKQIIFSGVFFLVIAMMTTGITGKKIYRAKPSGVLAVKEKRMKIAAVNGLVVLLPAAYLLASWSASGQFDDTFWTVQMIELVAGFTNAVLMGMNIRDGIRLGKRRIAKSAI